MLARRLLASGAARSPSRLAARFPLRGASAARHHVRPAHASALFSTIVHSSPHDEIHIPEHTIWEVIEDRVKTHADESAFICGITHEKLSFQELHEGAKRIAVALGRDGVRKGDVRIIFEAV